MQVLCLDVELLVDVAVVLVVLVVFGLVGLCRTSFSASVSRSVAFRCLKHKYSIRLEH